MITSDELETVGPSISQWDFDLPEEEDDDVSWTIDPYDDPVI